MSKITQVQASQLQGDGTSARIPVPHAFRDRGFLHTVGNRPAATLQAIRSASVRPWLHCGTTQEMGRHHQAKHCRAIR